MKTNAFQLGWILAALLLTVLVGSWVLGARRNEELLAKADSLRSERMEEARVADSLRVLLTATQKAVDQADAELTAERAWADTQAARYRARADSLSLVAAETGQEVRQAVLNALGAHGAPPAAILDVIDRHLEQDRRAKEAWETTLAEKEAALVATTNLAGAWKDRALLAEKALEAREAECQTCREEVRVLREAASPGFFQRIRRNAGILLGEAVVIVVLVVAL